MFTTHMSTTHMSTTLATTAAYHGGHWYGPGPGAGFGWLFLLIPLFWVGLIVLVASLFGRRWRRAAAARGYGYGPGPWARGPWGPASWSQAGPGQNGWAGSTSGAEQTLSDRFARGDIDEVEYRARLEVLRAGSSSGA